MRRPSTLWDIHILPQCLSGAVANSYSTLPQVKNARLYQMKIETQSARLGDIRRFTRRSEPSLAREIHLNNWQLQL
jgi:hypothetical protein